MKTVVYLQPIGQIDPDVLNFLRDALASILPIQVMDPVDLPRDAYDRSRNQYEGSALLDAMSQKDGVMLGITEVDAYVEGLNFIFGLACGRKALISLKRLGPGFYGSAEDGDQLRCRALKEAMHELGHVFGLEHCADRRCVMHFSNSIWDTDFKGWNYCSSCQRKIEI